MKDRIPTYPGRVKLTPVTGKDGYYDMERADEPEQAGSPLNKETFLKDATAELYGFDDTAVPDDVLAQIANTLTNFNAANIKSGILPVARGGTGKGSYAVNRLLYPSGSSTLSQLAFPTTAGSVLRQGTSGAPYWSTPKEIIEAMDGCRVVQGSYTGTNVTYGSDGSDQPVRIELGFEPKIVWLIRGDVTALPSAYSEDVYSVYFACFINPITTIRNYYSITGATSTTHGITVSWDETGMEFHINAVPDIAAGTVGSWSTVGYNSSGVTYHYIALG